MSKCKCITRIESEIKEQDFKGKKIEKVEFENTGLVMKDNKLSVHTYTEFVATIEGQKKKVPFKVFNSFCQFCGQKLINE